MLLDDVIEAVEVVDPQTVRLVLKAPDTRLLYVLGWGDAVMVSPRSAADNAVTPVGTGPFRFIDWRRGDSVVLERNPAYWGPAPRIDRVVFKFIADPTAVLVAYDNGELNVADDIDINAKNEYGTTDQYITSDRIGIQYWDFNCKLPDTPSRTPV